VLLSPFDILRRRTEEDLATISEKSSKGKVFEGELDFWGECLIWPDGQLDRANRFRRRWDDEVNQIKAMNDKITNGKVWMQS
jgi:hypothetical protein